MIADTPGGRENDGAAGLFDEIARNRILLVVAGDQRCSLRQVGDARTKSIHARLRTLVFAEEVRAVDQNSIHAALRVIETTQIVAFDAIAVAETLSLLLSDEIAFFDQCTALRVDARDRTSQEHTSELQSLMRISYAVFC